MTALACQTVLVPVDYSTESQHALAVGREVVTPGGVVHAVHVLHVAPIGMVVPATNSVEQIAHGEQHLQQFLTEAGVRDVKTHVMEGDPGHEIVKLAEQLHADLIVMPSHGRTGLAHVLIGSVAERVVRLAHCPVLVLRK
jgi:nucleotide-binding universal stress UspA family protein